MRRGGRTEFRHQRGLANLVVYSSKPWTLRLVDRQLGQAAPRSLMLVGVSLTESI